MVKILLSQYYLFHLVNLSDEQVKNIENEMVTAEQFVMAGTKRYPIVKFYVECDCISDPAEAFGDKFDGKGFEVSYGVLPKNEDNRFPIISPTQLCFKKELENEEIIPENTVFAIENFNDQAEGKFAFGLMNYKLSDVDATHMIQFFDMGYLAANFPLLVWQVAYPLHYIFNELNSNRKYRENGIDYDVLRFWDKTKQEEIYFAEVYEYIPEDEDRVSPRHVDYLFKMVDKKDIVFVD